MSDKADYMRGHAKLLELSSATPSLLWPDNVNYFELAELTPAPPRMIIDDWLPCGYAALLAATGGSGKSSITLHLCVCIALGIPFFGLPILQRKRVLYLSCEDRIEVLHWRLSRICDYLGVDIRELHGNLEIVDLVGHNTILWAPKVIATGKPMPAMSALGEKVAACSAEVILVDGISDSFAGNENARAEVKAYVNDMLSLVGPNGAVIFLGHTAKSGGLNGAESEYSGSTGWHNSVRARWFLSHETRSVDGLTQRTGDLIMRLQKTNLGAEGKSMRFSWDDDAHMFLGRVRKSENALDRRARDRLERQGIMDALWAVFETDAYVPAAASGNRTALHVLSVRPEFPNSLQSSTASNRRRFWRHIEHLRSMGEIREGVISRKDRKRTSTLEPVSLVE